MLHALVIDAIHPAGTMPMVTTVGRGEAAAILALRNNRWHLQASVTVSARNMGPPPARTDQLPSGLRWRAYLTGATDFVLPTYVFVDTVTAAVISDVGDHWHLLPFRTAKEELPGTFVAGRYAGPQPGVFVSGRDTCIPSCANGAITYQRWRYVANADAFEPTGAPYTLHS